MKNFTFRSDFFVPAFLFSLTAHLGILSVGQMFPVPPQVSVVQAPNSIEITLIEEKVVPEIEEIEEVITTAIVENQPVIQQIEKEVPLPKMEMPTTSAMGSQGAQVEAKPLEFFNPAPQYPLLARQRGWEGTVFLRVKVETDGAASSVEIETSSGYPILDRAALNAVKTWRFAPAQMGEMKFASWITVPVEFVLINS